MITANEIKKKNGEWNWREYILDERQRKELAFAELYARDFHHGTTGHNALILIAKLAEALDNLRVRYISEHYGKEKSTEDQYRILIRVGNDVYSSAMIQLGEPSSDLFYLKAIVHQYLNSRYGYVEQEVWEKAYEGNVVGRNFIHPNSPAMKAPGTPISDAIIEKVSAVEES